MISPLVIGDGGTAGWMGPSHSEDAFGGRIDVALVESAQVSMIGVGEAASDTVRHFPDSNWSPANTAACNERVTSTVDGAEELLVLHYRSARRQDTPCWKDVHQRPLPDSVAEKLEPAPTPRQGGHVPLNPGRLPRMPNPAPARIDPSDVQQEFTNLRAGSRSRRPTSRAAAST
ncbi:tryptophan 7-halogenase [Nocardiopsis xinjiangensis]|uniref:tryptophan 7-halogenase n=1 Tax=Nocardiopsis xinjiangensis TaxID=124285 RepID=UPI00034AE843|nr:tryptophan 7-halogenase [Nocardiopsis xinjiangensis]